MSVVLCHGLFGARCQSHHQEWVNRQGFFDFLTTEIRQIGYPETSITNYQLHKVVTSQKTEVLKYTALEARNLVKSTVLFKQIYNLLMIFCLIYVIDIWNTYISANVNRVLLLLGLCNIIFLLRYLAGILQNVGWKNVHFTRGTIYT